MAKPRRKSLQQQAKEILAQAEARGVQNNFFFATTFERYMTQIKILESLRGEIEEQGATVTKEYVKGRPNLCVNPAITEYNRTASAANNTVTTLINVLRSFTDDEGGSKLKAFMAASDD